MSYTSPGIKFLFVFLPVLIVLGACKKENRHLSNTIKIFSISPTAASFGVKDTINGKGFGTSSNNLHVFFNTTEAEVLNVTDTSIIVTVPKGAESGYIKLIINNNEIRGPAFSYIYSVKVETIAGTGFEGYQEGNAAEAFFRFPRGIAKDSKGNIYVADFGNYRVRKISVDGMVSTIAGNGNKGYKDGPALDAEFEKVNGLAVDMNDNIYIADGTRIRKYVAANKVIITFAGNGNNGTADGDALKAEFGLIYGIILDDQGNVYITDVVNNNIRKIDQHGKVTTVAGNISGYADGDGAKARFNMPGALAEDLQKNTFYVADAGNFRIRSLNASGIVQTFAGSGYFGYKDGRYTEAQFKYPTGIAVDAKGNVYVCGEEDVIRKIDLQGNVTTIAGTGEKGMLDGDGKAAKFNQPVYMLIDEAGTMYVSEISNHCIRKITIE
ncbi:MAG: IPT/TIG domain-containing protein [Ilyomonas sp.]